MAGVVVVHLSRNEQGFGLRFQEYTDGQGHMIVRVFENTEAARCGALPPAFRPPFRRRCSSNFSELPFACEQPFDPPPKAHPLSSGLIQEGDRLVKVLLLSQRLHARAHLHLQIGEEDVRLWEFQRMISFLKAQPKVKLSLKSASPAAF